MLTKRFVLAVVVLSLLFVTLAISSPFSRPPESSDLNGLPRPVIVPVTGTLEFSDYYQRHPELHGEMAQSVDAIWDRAPLDECFDVSLSEVAACRDVSELTSP